MKTKYPKSAEALLARKRPPKGPSPERANYYLHRSHSGPHMAYYQRCWAREIEALAPLFKSGRVKMS